MAPLILLVLALPASAAKPAPAPKIPDCIHVSTMTARPRFQPDLETVRECQEIAKNRLIDEAAGKRKPLTEAQIEKIEDDQRAEVRDYLANSGVVLDGKSKSGRGLGGVTKKDLERVTPEEGAEIGALEKRLHDAAGDGKDGITPAMGRDIIDSLTKKQGFVSPDMKELLDAVVRDGGKLTPETMKKLQGAGKAAKGAGLDLNIDKNTEKDLLEHDFDSDKDVPPAPPADPGNL